LNVFEKIKKANYLKLVKRIKVLKNLNIGEFKANKILV